MDSVPVFSSHLLSALGRSSHSGLSLEDTQTSQGRAGIGKQYFNTPPVILGFPNCVLNLSLQKIPVFRLWGWEEVLMSSCRSCFSLFPKSVFTGLAVEQEQSGSCNLLFRVSVWKEGKQKSSSCAI